MSAERPTLAAADTAWQDWGRALTARTAAGMALATAMADLPGGATKVHTVNALIAEFRDARELATDRRLAYEAAIEADRIAAGG